MTRTSAGKTAAGPAELRTESRRHAKLHDPDDNPPTTPMSQLISGAHAILYSRDPDADRAFLRDVLDLPHVDAGGGWLIFGLPPAEVAVHPTDGDAHHELYFICDDIEAFVAAAAARGAECGPVSDEGWGLLGSIALPGGGRIGVYQARHPRPRNP